MARQQAMACSRLGTYVCTCWSTEEAGKNSHYEACSFYLYVQGQQCSGLKANYLWAPICQFVIHNRDVKVTAMPKPNYCYSHLCNIILNNVMICISKIDTCLYGYHYKYNDILYLKRAVCTIGSSVTIDQLLQGTERSTSCTICVFLLRKRSRKTK